MAESEVEKRLLNFLSKLPITLSIALSKDKAEALEAKKAQRLRLSRDLLNIGSPFMLIKIWYNGFYEFGKNKNKN